MASNNAINAGTFPALLLSKGGTNANLTASNGGIFYSTASAGAILGGTATANQALLSGSSTTPVWSTATYPATTTINQILYSSAANVITGITTANSATLYTTTTGVPTMTAAMTNGQLLIGSTGANPVLGTLTQGANITITNGAGSITIASSAIGLTYVNQNTSSVTLAPDTAYYINNGASLVTATLPATAAQFDTYIIIGGSSGGWQINVGSGQTINLNSSATTTSTGHLASTYRYNCIYVTCIIANTTFVAFNATGVITVV
jgi:hypothetical protein